MSEENIYTFENKDYRKTYCIPAPMCWPRPSSACTRK